VKLVPFPETFRYKTFFHLAKQKQLNKLSLTRQQGKVLPSLLVPYPDSVFFALNIE